MSHVAHALRIASTIACGIVIVAFVFWASDEGRSGSDAQVARLSQSDGSTGAPTAPVTQTVPAAEHDGVRGAVEKANDALLSPFDGVASDGGAWARHAFPALLALLTYGLLARILIPYLVSSRRL